MTVTRSYWSATYTGPHHGVFIKKLERIAKIKAIELERERERFILNDERLEHSSFFVEHKASNWEELTQELLQTAHLIFPVWTVTIGSKSLAGATGPHLSGPNAVYTQRISGHREVRWEINALQQYQRIGWLNGKADHW